MANPGVARSQIRDRVLVITGANSGIGKAAALKFASEGWQVIMACRSAETGRKALHEITEASGNASVQLRQLDISSFVSIRRFCSAFELEHNRLDALVHNAGYFNHGITAYQFSPDGLELTFATNVFGRCYYHLCASEEFREVTGALVDSKYRIILPAEEKALTPIRLIRELWDTRHAPAYATAPANIERMWQLSREVISGDLAQGAGCP
ncbi:MAG TPA: SDR family NAD(P)-dependent oxidoreductase [Symbiobacteriaceae bacterium]|nr:SDR family NAD(P)-dependent oxidoreductase [Symbiobacteriaceae bacterium]